MELVEGKMVARDKSQHGPVRRKGKGVAGVFGSRQRNRGKERPVLASEDFDPLRLDHAEAEEMPLIPILLCSSQHEGDSGGSARTCERRG